MGRGKTGWGGSQRGKGSELRVACTLSQSLWEKRGSARVGEWAVGEMQSPSVPHETVTPQLNNSDEEGSFIFSQETWKRLKPVLP